MSIQIPFLFLFIKISRNGIWSLLYSIVNCIEGLIEFKVSNNSNKDLISYIKMLSKYNKCLDNDSVALQLKHIIS